MIVGLLVDRGLAALVHLDEPLRRPLRSARFGWKPELRCLTFRVLRCP